MMKAFISFMLALMFFPAAEAYRYTYDFDNIPLSRAIIHISKDHPDVNISFIYRELDNYRTSATIRTDSPGDALRQAVGHNPVSVTGQDGSFYVEALQHGKYIYRGRVVDGDNEPVVGAGVMLLSPKDSAVITYGIADAEGRFAIPCDRRGVTARVSCMGYQTVCRECPGFNCGTIVLPVSSVMLGQVQVEGQMASVSPEKSVFIPTSRQKNSAQDAIDLLSQMAIPQIRINPISKKVTDNSGDEVTVYINSLPASGEEMTGLRTADVRRVEYLEFPTDPRFRGLPKVINIIVHEYAYGGYTKLSASENLLIGLTSMTNLFSKFTYRRMTYDLYFGADNYRNSHDGSSSESVYSLFKDGNTYSVSRNEILSESKFSQNECPLTFRATYNTKKIQIRNTLGFRHIANPTVYRRGTLDYLPDIAESYTYGRNNPQRNNSVSYSGSWFFSLPKDFAIDVAPTVNYTHTNNTLDYSAGNTTITRHARENAYNFEIDGNLRKQLGRKHSVSVGINGGRWSNNLHYTGTDVYDDKFSTAFVYSMVGYGYRTKKIAVNLNAGFIWENSDINDYRKADRYPCTHISVRYSLNPKNQFSLYFQYANNSAEITEKASDILQDNELLYISGNPDLRNSRHTTLNLTYTWLPSNAFGMSVYGRFFGLYDRMFQTYEHYNDGAALLRTWINDGDYLSGKIGMAFNWKLLDGNLQFYATPELSLNKITGKYPLTYNPFNLNVQINYYLRQVYFRGLFMLPQKGMISSSNATYHNRYYYGLTAGWSNSDWNIRFSAYNMFNRGWENSFVEVRTPLYSAVRTNYGNYNHPRLTFSLTYTFGYGKKVKRGNEVGAQEGAGSAILK